jgi:hypothetical protein
MFNLRSALVSWLDSLVNKAAKLWVGRPGESVLNYLVLSKFVTLAPTTEIILETPLALH